MYGKSLVNTSHRVNLEGVVSSSEEIHCDTHCVGLEKLGRLLPQMQKALDIL
jgi:hypothetical protein